MKYENFDLGAVNIPATIYRRNEVRTTSGSVEVEWQAGEQILVSIVHEYVDGRLLSANLTEVGTLTVECWDYPLNIEDRMEVDGVMYRVLNVSLLRNYHKQILLTRNEC